MGDERLTDQVESQDILRYANPVESHAKEPSSAAATNEFVSPKEVQAAAAKLLTPCEIAVEERGENKVDHS